MLLRILNYRLQFRDLVANVFTFDSIGALLASLIFSATHSDLSGISIFERAYTRGCHAAETIIASA